MYPTPQFGWDYRLPFLAGGLAYPTWTVRFPCRVATPLPPPHLPMPLQHQAGHEKPPQHAWRDVAFTTTFPLLYLLRRFDYLPRARARCRTVCAEHAVQHFSLCISTWTGGMQNVHHRYLGLVLRYRAALPRAAAYARHPTLLLPGISRAAAACATAAARTRAACCTAHRTYAPRR